MTLTDGEALRLQHLAENIKQALTLANEYEKLLLVAADPREKIRHQRDITELLALADDYQGEYDQLSGKEADGATQDVAEVGVALGELGGKMETLLAGQIQIKEQLEEIPRALMERYDATEQAIVATLIDRLDVQQATITYAVLSAVEAGSVPAAEMQVATGAIEETLTELRDQPALLQGEGLSAEVDRLSDALSEPTVGVSQKLKLTLPIIPFILAYEGELELKTVMKLRGVWRSLKARIRGEG